MKSYMLSLYYKQGDDLENLLRQCNGVEDALRCWAELMRANAQTCETIAAAISGKQVKVIADTHHISFETDDPEAEKALHELADLKILTQDDAGDDEE